MYQPKENIWKVEFNLNYDKVTDYVKEKEKNFKKTQNSLENMKNIFNDYLSITKKYSEQIQNLALKLKPLANTIEGDLTQAIQSVLLFNSDSLETFIKEMNKIINAPTMESKNTNHYEFSEFCKSYQPALSELFTNYCIYIEEIEKYERYLMNKEMGFYNADTKISKTNGQMVLKNNIKTVLEKKKNYTEKVEPLNILIDKLVELGAKEEEIINEEYFNICNKFVNKLNECLEIQKENYKAQLLVLDDLYKIIKSEKLENFNSGIQQYSLHCLSIYINAKNIKRNKDNENIPNQKNDFDIYKKITLKNIENIIEEMKKNGLEITEKDLKDLEVEKIKDFIERKTKIICDNKEDDFTEEDKNKIINYIKEEKEYRLFFLQILNNERVKGGGISNIKIFNYIGDIFRAIKDKIIENDYREFKYISIISMTYFYALDDNKKKYLVDFIKDDERIKNTDFWEKCLIEAINVDGKKSDKKESQKIKEKEDFKKQFIIFSNTISIISNMKNFELDESLIKEFISLVEKKYKFTEMQKKQINESLDPFIISNKKK